MRILWFVNSCFPAVDEHLKLSAGTYGWWLVSLASDLAKRQDISLGVAWASPLIDRYKKFEIDHITYYCIPMGKRKRAVSKIFSFILPLLKFWKFIANFMDSSLQEELNSCLEVSRDFQPDLIHINGTENFYGLITPHTKHPVLISLQGILHACVKEFWGPVPRWKRFFYPEAMYIYRKMVWDAKREQRIFHTNKYFSGRTDWDRGYQAFFQPAGLYYKCQRANRPRFYQEEWSLRDCRKHSIYVTTKPHPYKGCEHLIEAVAYLLPDFPDVQLRIGGPFPNTGYAKHLRRKAKQLNLETHVVFLGQINADQIIHELQQTNVYVLPSLVENNSNSLVEAQLVGVPCIAAYTGGIPSMMTHGNTGLLYPRGDVATLAITIQQIFNDPHLAESLGKGARETALIRNDPKTILETQVEMYYQIIGLESTAV